MDSKTSKALCLASALLPLATAMAGGQAKTTDSRIFDVSTFAGLDETSTGINGGRNLGFTAGFNVKFTDYRGLGYAFESRSMLAISPGSVVGEKDSLAGLRVERRVGHMLLLGDFLAGHGNLTYQSGGYYLSANRFLYYVTDSVVLSAGGGVEMQMTEKISLRVDVQMQHWDTPVASSGSIVSVPVLVGFVYHLPSHPVRRPLR